MAWGAIAATAIPVVAGMMMGRKQKGPDYGPALRAIGGVGVPAIEDLKVQLQELVSAGEISPIQADAILQQATQYEDIELDPYTREAQMKALQQMQDVYSAEGLDPIAQGRLAEAQQQFRTTERGAREALLQRAQERGLGSSELSIANALQGGQQAATEGSMMAQQAAADANMRALSALQASGELGGQIRGMDWNQAAQVAAAQDEIARFNVMSRQQAQQENIARRESADYANLAEQQRIADYNTSLVNQQRMYDANLAQQKFENEMRKAEAIAGVYGQQAQGNYQAAAQNQAMMGQMIGLGGQMGSAYLNYAANQPRQTQPGTMTTQVMPNQYPSFNQLPYQQQNKLSLNYVDPNKRYFSAMPYSQPS